jgi:hypothetical protein
MKNVGKIRGYLLIYAVLLGYFGIYNFSSVVLLLSRLNEGGFSYFDKVSQEPIGYVIGLSISILVVNFLSFRAIWLFCKKKVNFPKFFLRVNAFYNAYFLFKIFTNMGATTEQGILEFKLVLGLLVFSLLVYIPSYYYFSRSKRVKQTFIVG